MGLQMSAGLKEPSDIPGHPRLGTRNHSTGSTELHYSSLIYSCGHVSISITAMRFHLPGYPGKILTASGLYYLTCLSPSCISLTGIAIPMELGEYFIGHSIIFVLPCSRPSKLGAPAFCFQVLKWRKWFRRWGWLSCMLGLWCCKCGDVKYTMAKCTTGHAP